MSHVQTTPEIQNTRTAYREGGLLSAAALVQDSQNRVDMQSLHQRVAHTSGIVAGLFVDKVKDRKEKNKEEIAVGPGAAIDHEGRLLLVRGTIYVPNPTGQAIAVWLRLKVTTSTTVVPASSAFPRDQEEVQIDLSVRSGIELAEPIDNQHGILLAVISADGQVSHSYRRYAGAVGQRIDSPSGRTQVVLGPQSSQDSRRFAIGVRSTPELPLVDILKWEATGTITLSAPTRIGTPPKPSSDVITPSRASIGAPSVKVTADDILDLCRVRQWIKCIGARPMKISQAESENSSEFSLSRYFRSCANEFLRQDDNPATKGSDSMARTDRVVECLNRMIREVDDANLNAAYHPKRRPTAYRVRRKLDRCLAGALRPLSETPLRGLSFRGAGPAEAEPQPCMIHLVEGVKEGQPFRQLRITIKNPGKENSPHRYRCSLGQADCQHPLVPVDVDQMIWNRQTGTQPGILSVLADGSVDIHKSLSVLPRSESLTPGLILKLEPPGTGPLSGIPAASAAPVLATAILWDDPVMRRDAVITGTGTALVLGGSLRNTTDLSIEGVSASLYVFAKNNTTLPLVTFPLFTAKQIPPRESLPLDSQNHRIPDNFNGLPIVVTFMIHGSLRNNSLAQSIYRREFPPP